MRSVAGVDARSQPTNTYVSSSSSSPGTASALSRQPYDSCDESERADHELWLLFVNRLDIAFRSSHEGPRDGAHCPAAVQPLSLIGCRSTGRRARANALSLWRLLQGVARRANAGAASLQLEHHKVPSRCVNGSAMARWRATKPLPSCP